LINAGQFSQQKDQLAIDFCNYRIEESLSDTKSLPNSFVNTDQNIISTSFSALSDVFVLKIVDTARFQNPPLFFASAKLCRIYFLLESFHFILDF